MSFFWEGGGGVGRAPSEGSHSNYIIAQHLLTAELISRRTRDGPHDSIRFLNDVFSDLVQRFLYYFSKKKHT